MLGRYVQRRLGERHTLLCPGRRPLFFKLRNHCFTDVSQLISSQRDLSYSVHSAARSTSPGQTHRSVRWRRHREGWSWSPRRSKPRSAPSPRGPRTPRGAPNSRPGPWAAAGKRPARPRRPAGFSATRRHLQTRAPLRAARVPACPRGAAFPRGASAARAALPARPPRPARRPM